MRERGRKQAGAIDAKTQHVAGLHVVLVLAGEFLAEVRFFHAVSPIQWAGQAAQRST